MAEFAAVGDVIARSFFESNNLETALDLSSRFLQPLQDTDTRAMTFGVIALVISSITSFLVDDDKAKNAASIGSGIDFDNNLIQNRNGLRKDFSGKLEKELEASINEVTIDNYKEAVTSFEEFMNWTRYETKDDRMLEDVLELAISKARGMKNPADILYKNIIDVTFDMYKKVDRLVSYYLFK